MANHSNIADHVGFMADKEWWKIQLSLISIQQSRKSSYLTRNPKELPYNFWSLLLTRLSERATSSGMPPTVGKFERGMADLVLGADLEFVIQRQKYEAKRNWRRQ